jgi:hypothetical protein
MRLPKPHFLTAAGAAILLALPQFCLAAEGAQQFAIFIQEHVINQALDAFWGIAAATVFFYGVRMVYEAYNEKAYTDVINSFIYVFSGFAVIACAMAFPEAFGPNTINPDQLVPGIASVVDFIFSAAAGVFTLIVVIAGIRIVATQGDQGEFDKWRKVLAGNVIGVMLMFVGKYIVLAVSQRDPAIIVEEMRGIALFILTVIGFGAVVALIAAGIYLIISIDESYRDKAKRIVIGTLLSLAIVIMSYTLIITLVPTNP